MYLHAREKKEARETTAARDMYCEIPRVKKNSGEKKKKKKKKRQKEQSKAA